ncbi:MAG: nuclease A inhibitor family protein [Cyanobacteria bacterium P01_D01_bin.116]
MGISTAFCGIYEQDFNSSLIFDIRDFALSKPNNQELVLAIEKAIDEANLLILYRSDASHFVWEIGENRNSVFLNLLVKTKYFTIQEYFYDNEDEEHENIFEFDESTIQLINTELTNLRYYFFGSVFMDIYLVGQTRYRDWISIKSTVVEYFQ